MPAMRWLAPSLIALALSASEPGSAVAQVAAEASSVAWRPATPLQGSLVVMEVRPAVGDSVVAVRGELAGELLHFERRAGVFRALGAVPVTAQDSMMMLVVIERATGASEALTPSFPVARRRAPREELRTAPEFVQPPESLAAGIEAERELIQEIKHRAHTTPRLWRGPFARPRPGPVTSGFGVTRLFNGTVQSRHLGVDFAGRRGAAIRAANRGIVVFAGTLYYSGTAIFLDHGAGLITAYFHLSRTVCAVGDTVHRGQVIGHVGTSGRVTGPHLHWHAAYGTVSVDPLALLTIDLPAPEVTQSESPP
jgi:murein DD-endopeptidase MepM/ murein hydrolase activator NlpD